MFIGRAGFMGIFAVVFLVANPAHSQGCRLDQHKLQCGKKDAAIFLALASQETSKLLNTPEDALDAFQRPVDLETFRRSIETNWKAVNRVEIRERSRMLRRQISASEFEEWKQSYAMALTNYRSAMDFYRTLVWYGKTGKPAPQDRDD